MTGGILQAKGLEKGSLVTCNPSTLVERRDSDAHFTATIKI
jgi:hypothetical protein